jgi:hypothetical protein
MSESGPTLEEMLTALARYGRTVEIWRYNDGEFGANLSWRDCGRVQWHTGPTIHDAVLAVWRAHATILLTEASDDAGEYSPPSPARVR